MIAILFIAFWVFIEPLFAYLSILFCDLMIYSADVT